MKSLLLRFLPLACFTLVAPGCTTVVRENILSSINTGIGVTVAENPQTQLYELKAGFIRTQFYSVPTGKKVKRCEGCDTAEGSPAETPTVLSGIRAKSSAKDLFLGMDIAESFAVGVDAAKSDAAVAMYIAMADSNEKASSASSGLTRARRFQAEAAKAEALEEELGRVIENLDGEGLEKARQKALELGIVTQNAIDKTVKPGDGGRSLKALLKMSTRGSDADLSLQAKLLQFRRFLIRQE